MELTRKQVIKWLSILRENLIYFPEISNKQKIESLDYAISSLKTDEAYQLMYEGEEIYTKADMIIMLEDLLMEIKHTVTMEEDTSSNEDLVKRDNVMKVVQSRIDKLKEDKK